MTGKESKEKIQDKATDQCQDNSETQKDLGIWLFISSLLGELISLEYSHQSPGGPRGSKKKRWEPLTEKNILSRFREVLNYEMSFQFTTALG